MKTKLLFLSVIAAALSLAGCGRETDPNPEEGEVVFKTIWPDQMPASYVIRVGETETEAKSANATLPGNLETGKHNYGVFNKPSALIFTGTVAAAPETAGYIGSVPMLYGATGTFEFTANQKHEVPVSLKRQTRNLKVTLNITDGKTGSLNAVEGELSGVAKSIDIDGEKLSGEGRLKSAFTLTDGAYSALVTLFGVSGQQQTLSLALTLPHGTHSVAVDMSEALAQFNSDKNTQLEVSLDVKDVELESVSVTVSGWEEAPIEPQTGVTQPSGGTQVTFDWPGLVGNIDAVEIYDSSGNLYASTVENGKTVDLYERPSDIFKIWVYSGGKDRNASLNLDFYDAATGTAHMSNTYFIDTPEELGWVDDLSGSYLIREDLDMTGITLDPIGYINNNDDYAAFKGTFDGGGKEISNFTLNLNTQFSGLISVNMGVIKNLNIVSGNIGEKKAGITGLGAICGYNVGTIQDCTNGVTVNGWEFLGGIAGQNDYVMKNCRNTGAVNGERSGGGITGYSYGSIDNCENAGTITVRQYVGGISGYLHMRDSNSYIKNCKNSGIVKAGHIYAGGIVGECHQGLIAYCDNTGDVTAGYNSGGIAGILSGDTSRGTIEYCTNSATIKITTSSRGAGIAGETSMGAIWACHNTGTISVRAYAGGIVGQALKSSIIAGCKNEGNLTGTSTPIGGIAGGILEETELYACYSTGNVKANGRAGGVVGSNNVCDVLACYSTGTINPGTNASTSYGGGVVGYMHTGGSTITASYYANHDKGWGYGLEGPYDAFKFNDPIDPEDLSQGVYWPSENASLKWGVYASDKDPKNGYIWASLGAAPETYPTLWWEVSGMKQQPLRFRSIGEPGGVCADFRFVNPQVLRDRMESDIQKRSM